MSRAANVRGLGEPEKNALPEIIGQCIDLNIVEIHNRRWTPLTPKNVTVVRGHKIFYPNDPGPAGGVYHLAHMVHEMVHVWQYLHMGIGLYSPRWLNRRYHYTLEDGKRFGDYGLEQQAAMFEDFFRAGNGLPFRWVEDDPSLSRLVSMLQTCSEDFGPRIS